MYSAFLDLVVDIAVLDLIATRLWPARSRKSADGQTPGVAFATASLNAVSVMGPRAVLKLRLRNPGNICYANSTLLALAWGCQDWLKAADKRNSLGRLLHLLNNQLTFGSLNLLEVPQWATVTRRWHHDGRQQDASEFLLSVLQAAGIHTRFTTWQARGASASIRGDAGHGSILVALRDVIQRPLTTIQEGIDMWHQQLQLCALWPRPQYVVLQLDRFRDGGIKDFVPVTVPAQVCVPCFSNGTGLDLEWAFYGLRAAICHVGMTMHSGHYQSFLYGDFSPATSDPVRGYLTDDAVPAVESSLLEIQSDAYLILLQLIPQMVSSTVPDFST